MGPSKWRSLSSDWQVVWRRHVISAYRILDQRQGYCRAAQIAQAEMVMYGAEEAVEAKQGRSW